MFSEALAKINQIPRHLKKNMFYTRSVAGVKPSLLKNPSRVIKEVILSNFEGKVIGQSADYLLANTEDAQYYLRKNCPTPDMFPQ
jgi:hypothetical protein